MTLTYNKPDAITRTDSNPLEAAPKSEGSGVGRPKPEKIAYVEVRIENHLKKPIVVALDGGPEVEIKSQQVSTSKHTANSKHQLKLTGLFGVIEKEIQLHDDDMVIPIK